MNHVAGFKLVSDGNLVVPDGYTAKYVNRSIKERLFTKLYGRKWSPFCKKELVITKKYKPDSSFYKMGDIVMAHPETLIRLKGAIGEKSPI
jgi:hypothetical protein